MRTRGQVTAEKLRGGYYTPARLVDFCYQRASELLGDRASLTLLEPSAGDGAFLRGLARTPSRLADRVTSIHAIELVPEEAAKAELSMRSNDQRGQVERGSALSWAVDTDEWFDLVVGNPPFVRYQFIDDDDKQASGRLAERLGVRFGGVANLWIPVLLGALARLRSGGAAALVLPTECFTGMSARVVREWLMLNMTDVTFDLFPPGSFPDVLQEVAVMSGVRTTRSTGHVPAIAISEHSRHRVAPRSWTYQPPTDGHNWTRSLLDPPHLEALAAATELPTVRKLAQVARIEVSIVTGANTYFCVDDGTADRFDLRAWARPLLARSRQSPGLLFRGEDHEAAVRSGSTAWLLDFGDGRPDPVDEDAPRRYLEHGVGLGLPQRYKCRIRDPWYRVPSIRAGSLLLSKRSHLFPRLLLNEAGAFTTDTIYRGELVQPTSLDATDLVAGFHSSLTLLTVELEGRSFGGGVLELVPSEIARLVVVAEPGLGAHLDRLDTVSRSQDSEALVRETDDALVRSGLVPRDLLSVLSEARLALLGRRLERNVGQVVHGDAAIRAA